jgi:EmrB/QacA subfamily drug resistance transporter
MNAKLTASLLILAAVLANVGFTALGSIFNYPDVLDEPAGGVLADFRAHETAVSAWFSVLALSAALFAPIAIGVGRLSSARLMRFAVPVGIAAAVVQVVGLSRWPILVPGYAADAASADAGVAAGARDAFTTASDILGTAIGETIGYALTATWTVLVIVALKRRYAGRWFSVLGMVSAALVFAGVLSPLGVQAIDTANFLGYVLWSVWLIAFAVVIVLHERRGGRARREALGRGDDMTSAGDGARGRWLALAVLCTSLLVIVVDNTIVNVALPTLARDLRADVSELQWVVDAYTLVFAGLLLLAGALGDRFGRRLTLLCGLAVFGGASAWAAYAGGVDELIVARAVMGAGAALIMPSTLSLLISVFTDARERATAIGLWAATAGLCVALGPVVGGVLLERFWWGSIFVVNVPLAALALVAGRVLIPESRNPVARRIDWTGAGISGAGLVALVWAVIEAPSKGWTSAPVLGAGALAAVALVAFVAWQRRADEPLLDVRLFRDARFSAASATVTVLFFCLFGFLFAATQYLQFVLGYSPSAAGVRVLPYAVAMIVCAPLSSKLVARFGTKGVATTGMLLFATGLALAATATTATGYGRLAVALALMGAGMGLAGAPATESIMSSLPPARANIGSAVNDTTRELGGALGVAIVGSIVSSLYATQLSGALPDDVPAPVAAAARESLGAAVGVGGDLGAGVADAAREAFVHALARASLVAALMAAFGAALAWRYLPSRGRDRATPSSRPPRSARA